MRVKVIRVSPYFQSMIEELQWCLPLAEKSHLEKKIANYILTTPMEYVEEPNPAPPPRKVLSPLISGKTVTTYHTGVTETTIELSEEGKRALTVPEGAFGSRRR